MISINNNDLIFVNAVNKWLYVQLIFQSLIVLWTSHHFHLILNMFVPISGRSGALKNPEVNVAIICSALTLLMTSYLVNF